MLKSIDMNGVIIQKPGIKYTHLHAINLRFTRYIMKILGLDLGDQWTGIAISDATQMFARPVETVSASELDLALMRLLSKEKIETIVAGLPRTMKGGSSQQTEKVIKEVETLKQKFIQVSWIMWDERLSSKRAEAVKPSKTKEEKLQSHARAAAFILQSYLDHLKFKKEDSDII